MAQPEWSPCTSYPKCVSHLLHAGEGLAQLVELFALRPGEVLELREEERVLEDALDRPDQVRLQRRRLLLPRVQRVQEVLQGVVAVVCKKIALKQGC